DDLVEALPPGVRLRQLSPQVGRRRTSSTTARTRRAAPTAPETREVRLRIRGEAADDEELLAFVDRLFGHPAFGEPDLASENRGSSGVLSFDLTVLYRPDHGPVAAEVP